MTRWEQHGSRDMTFSRWHREWTELYIGENEKRLDLCDLDWIEYCGPGRGSKRAWCWRPIAFLELAQDRGSYEKTAIVTKKTAEQARVPAAVVFYKPTGAPGQIASFRVRVIYPVERPDEVLTPAQMAHWLQAIHDAHTARCNGQYSEAPTRVFDLPPFPARG